MNTLLQDVRYALRIMLKRPGFTIIAVLTLALGISTSTTLFSVVNATLFQALPLTPEPTQVFRLSMIHPQFVSQHHVSWPDYVDFRDDGAALFDLALYTSREVPWRNGEQLRYLAGQIVSGNFFPVLRVPVTLGRTLTVEDDQPGAAPAVVISYSF
ncbi:MAG: ABC transporter permease, partial [Pyrinomonadaceae bacterium]